MNVQVYSFATSILLLKINRIFTDFRLEESKTDFPYNQNGNIAYFLRKFKVSLVGFNDFQYYKVM